MRKVFNIRQQRKINFDFQRCVLFGCIVFIIFIDNPVSVYFLACVFPVSRLIPRRVRLWFGIGYNIQRSVRLISILNSPANTSPRHRRSTLSPQTTSLKTLSTDLRKSLPTPDSAVRYPQHRPMALPIYTSACTAPATAPTDMRRHGHSTPPFSRPETVDMIRT